MGGMGQVPDYLESSFPTVIDGHNSAFIPYPPAVPYIYLVDFNQSIIGAHYFGCVVIWYPVNVALGSSNNNL